MKYKGQIVKGKNREVIPIPREGEDIIFIAEAVQNWKEFEDLVPEPQPPEIIKPGGVRIKDTKDLNYIKAMAEFNTKRTCFLVLYSLQATKELEWETVKLNDPKTWKNYESELEQAGFTQIEMGRILTGVMRANSLDETMIDEARANFLLGQQGSER